MSDERFYLTGAGVLWIQPDGPNTEPQYLGCHSLEGVSRNRGDMTLLHAPDPAQPNRFIPVGYFQGTPGPVEMQIKTDLRPVADWLEMIDCAVPVYLAVVSCGRRDAFASYDRLFIFDRALISNDDLGTLAVTDPGDQKEAAQVFDLRAVSMHRIFRINSADQKAVATTGRTAYCVAFIGDHRCWGSCGKPVSPEQTGYLGLAGLIGGQSNVYRTTDAGKNWLPTASSPFAQDEDVTNLITIQIAKSNHRLMAARGTADLLNPAEIAYSDDGGDTWVQVDVGAVNGQYAPGKGRALYAYDNNLIVLATSGGYIYTSVDQGLTWTLREAGGLTTNDLMAVSFASRQIGFVGGAGNSLLKTTNSGVDWVALSGPAAEGLQTIQGLWAISEKRIWLGYDDGNLWYTEDGGDTWFQRDYPGSGTGQITGVAFANDYCGYMTHISAGGTVGTLFRTVTGGWEWESIPLPTNTGPLYDLEQINCNLVYVAGEF